MAGAWPRVCSSGTQRTLALSDLFRESKNTILMGLMEKLRLSCTEELDRLLGLELVFRLMKGHKRTVGRDIELTMGF